MGFLEEYSHFFEVRTGLFDGPIDLLLHLVKTHELEIEKVALAEVATQYLACLEHARGFDLEVAGEHLVIAATLVSIKASLLLQEPVAFVQDEDGNFIDPHQALLEKLRLAEVFRESAQELGSREQLGIDVFAPPSLDEEMAPEPSFGPHDPFLLGRALKRLLDRAKAAGRTLTIEVDSVSILDRMMTIMDQLKAASGPIRFDDLFDGVTSRGVLVSSFVSLLELAKRSAIRIEQADPLGEIFIALSSDEVATGNAFTVDTITAESISSVSDEEGVAHL